MTDFEEILSVLEGSGAKYLLVGGHAVMLYVQPRFTKDLDILVEPSEANAEIVYKCLSEFGAPLANLSPKDFAEPGCFYIMGRPPWQVDIITRIDGVTFDEAWAGKVRKPFGDTEINVIGREQLIRNKRASGRHIDLHDAEQLEKSEELPPPTG